MKHYIEKEDRFEFQVNVEKNDGDIKVSCHIPAYDIYFSSEDNEADIRKKTHAMVKSWMQHYGIK